MGWCGLVTQGGDCNDENPAIFLGAPEACNAVDDNCDGYACESCSSADADNDGFSECDSDCDDSDPAVYPGAPELCDGKDNNCNGLVDETKAACAPDGLVPPVFAESDDPDRLVPVVSSPDRILVACNQANHEACNDAAVILIGAAGADAATRGCARGSPARTGRRSCVRRVATGRAPGGPSARAAVRAAAP